MIYEFRQPEYDPGAAKEPLLYRMLLAWSSIKLAEVFTLCRSCAFHLYWILVFPWLQGLIAAILLHFANISMDRADFQRRDVLTGALICMFDSNTAYASDTAEEQPRYMLVGLEDYSYDFQVVSDGTICGQ